MTTFADILEVEVEHMLGDTHGGLVKLRVITDGVIALGQLTPTQAREIACSLHECAARAEYEQDFYSQLKLRDFPDELVGVLFGCVRTGEYIRHTGITPPGATS